MQNRRDIPEEPKVGTGETESEVLDRIYRLPYEQQHEVLVALAPRILGRLEEEEREALVNELKKAPIVEQKLSRPAPSGMLPDDPAVVVGDVLRQSFGEQLRLWRLIAPRILADLEGHERTVFFERLEHEIEKAVAGDTALEEHPIA
ncbi:MAG: hypothetical protein ACOX6T_20570 [Myxococcales bacterium]|jgi:hypothetical protein